jgi:hypothetical protein
MRELASLFNVEEKQPWIDVQAFPDTAYGDYITVTPSPALPGQWGVSFSNGNLQPGVPEGRVRCVR